MISYDQINFLILWAIHTIQRSKLRKKEGKILSRRKIFSKGKQNLRNYIRTTCCSSFILGHREI